MVSPTFRAGENTSNGNGGDVIRLIIHIVVIVEDQ